MSGAVLISARPPVVLREVQRVAASRLHGGRRHDLGLDLRGQRILPAAAVFFAVAFAGPFAAFAGPFAAVVRIPASGRSGSVAVSRPGIIAGPGIVSGSVFVAVSGLSAAGVIPGAVSLLSRAGIGVFGQGDVGFDPGDGVAGRVEYAGPGFSARCREQRRAQGAQ